MDYYRELFMLYFATMWLTKFTGKMLALGNNLKIEIKDVMTYSEIYEHVFKKENCKLTVYITMPLLQPITITCKLVSCINLNSLTNCLSSFIVAYDKNDFNWFYLNASKVECMHNNFGFNDKVRILKYNYAQEIFSEAALLHYFSKLSIVFIDNENEVPDYILKYLPGCKNLILLESSKNARNIFVHKNNSNASKIDTMKFYEKVDRGNYLQYHIDEKMPSFEIMRIIDFN
jgi:hypothetical protein